jgi:CxxC-x17-CxxC domain-containing protein
MEFYKSKYSDKKKSDINRSGENEPSRSFRNSGDDRGSRYSRDDSRGESTTVTCSDCRTECQVPFVPRNNKPVYCSDCFRQHKPQDSGSDRDDRGSRNYREVCRGEYTTVICSDCSTECQVPFVPRNNKPVYCSDCFRQHKPQDSGSDRDDRGGSRYSRDDRGGSRSSSGRESRNDSSSSRKPRNDKFLRKQESFYSNGSDKFYETIKEKLYEILGGKTCSSCGFKDEKALGISPISDTGNSGSDGRGGDAASWGKYISAPELAREELKVFCLNCNEIREPVSKPTKDRSSSKKSKYFPR